jgi:hypothetical protein
VCHMRRSCRWFINAAPYFEALLEVLPLAKRSVYIADWHAPLWVVVGFACTDLGSLERVAGGRESRYFAPGLYLRRGAQLDPAHRVDNLLKAYVAANISAHCCTIASAATHMMPRCRVRAMIVWLSGACRSTSSRGTRPSLPGSLSRGASFRLCPRRCEWAY